MRLGIFLLQVSTLSSEHLSAPNSRFSFVRQPHLLSAPSRGSAFPTPSTAKRPSSFKSLPPGPHLSYLISDLISTASSPGSLQITCRQNPHCKVADHQPKHTRCPKQAFSAPITACSITISRHHTLGPSAGPALTIQLEGSPASAGCKQSPCPPCEYLVLTSHSCSSATQLAICCHRQHHVPVPVGQPSATASIHGNQMRPANRIKLHR